MTAAAVQPTAFVGSMLSNTECLQNANLLPSSLRFSSISMKQTLLAVAGWAVDD